jgi:fatty acid desaturase
MKAQSMPRTTLRESIDVQHFLHQDKPVWNAIAFLYTFSGYAAGIALILQNSGWLNALGVLLLTHTLMISAYLAHELMHGTIFDSMKWNVLVGELMLWLNGGCYARFQDLARLHIAHHIDRVDFCRFDLATFLNDLPTFIRSTFLVLEWMYIPALAFLSRFRSIFAPFRVSDRKSERGRVLLILAVRITLFVVLGIVSFKALALYFLAYIGMVTGLRFVDAFQHTYEVFSIGGSIPKRDRAHEQANTFSNLVSQRYWWLNLLLLNFGYHNAHHELMKCPWHRLHELDRQLFSGQEVHYVTLPKLLHNYHRYRVQRVFSGQGTAIDAQGNPNLETFYGGIEVSFLVLPS